MRHLSVVFLTAVGKINQKRAAALFSRREAGTYDAVGNQLTARDFDGAYTMTYDALNRVETAANMWGQSLLFYYDEVGKPCPRAADKGCVSRAPTHDSS